MGFFNNLPVEKGLQPIAEDETFSTISVEKGLQPIAEDGTFSTLFPGHWTEKRKVR